MRVVGWFKPPCEMKVTDEKVLQPASSADQYLYVKI